MNKKLNILIVAILFLSAQHVFGQEWTVPADKENVTNPSEYNLANVKKGKDIYQLNCKSCHGDAGKNNALPLVPVPPDVVSEKMQANTEGGLFYKITAGKGGMPQFETTLSEDDRWRLVNYIMNYNSKNEPVLVDAPPVKAKLLASVNEADKIVEIFAEYENKGEFVKLSGAPIIISAKKAFGNIELGKVLSDENGRAEFAIPENVIGDEEGFVNIVVALEENFEVVPVILDKAKVGKLKEVPKLIRGGEILWSTNENIQPWLLLTYLGAVGAAWLAIGYVVFQILKIRRYSKE
ncbi:MAG: cytochrome c [Prolixibacteraceae bacterium]|jgi:mono/diheme cytochrome c family protein|nr:cytochrome c [Prolixibacteraceae bacterium]MBT6764889.1 cytochrome c [Prolixibacteraceae bacterium]MBT7001029.1 cytochrome c [Prolixibacteraceae bacterium]MBT7393683.1 cytochrome c [Prolixibacteraceae bacterium]